MAKLTDVRDTPEIANGAKVIAVPVKGGTTIYQGALVALDASGYAIPGKKAESLTAVGRAEETVTNTGADGELVIRVDDEGVAVECGGYVPAAAAAGVGG